MSSMISGEEKAGPPSSIYVRAATGHEIFTAPPATLTGAAHPQPAHPPAGCHLFDAARGEHPAEAAAAAELQHRARIGLLG